MDRNYKKGFTLIELLVVIAIIGILSAVVLASLNTARQRGADASIRQNLSQIRAQAELVYDGVSPNSYETVCDDTNIAAMVNEATNRSSGTAVCNDSETAWAAWAPLNSSGAGVFCADSTGVAHDQAAAPAGGATSCS